MNSAANESEQSLEIFTRRQLEELFAALTPYPALALAVSGGADSMALMLLVHSWLEARPSPRIAVLTVDHRLREGSAAEAEWVDAQARRLGFAHHILPWTGEKPRTGIQATARSARYGLLTGFAREHGMEAVVTAHTRDDQAETLIMRLARGSGLDGLSAMAPLSDWEGIHILRPLLAVPRIRIEAFLRRQGQSWIEDPTNRDGSQERARIRGRLPDFGALGLTGEALALSARRLRRARQAIEAATGDFLRARLTLHEAGYAEIPLPAFLAVPEEIALKALAAILPPIGGGGAPVSLSKLEACLDAMRAEPGKMTLRGCELSVRRGKLMIVREFGRMDRAPVPIQPGETLIWDGRFRVTLPATETHPADIRPLGADGLAALRKGGGGPGVVPRAAALALPSIWRGEALRHAPFARFEGGPLPGWIPQSQTEFIHGPTLFAKPCADPI